VTLQSNWPCALMPLVVLTALQLCGLVENRRRSAPRAMAFFAVAFLAVWLSNAPAAVVNELQRGATLCVGCAWEKSFAAIVARRGWTGAGIWIGEFLSIASGLRATLGEYLASAFLGSATCGTIFSTRRSAIRNITHSIWIASSVAVLLLVMTGLAGNCRARSNSGTRKTRGKKTLARAADPFRCVVDSDGQAEFVFFGRHLPKLRFVQFPWRWMAIVAVPYAYFSATAMMRRRWIWGAVVLVAICGTATLLGKKTWWDSDDIPSLAGSDCERPRFRGHLMNMIPWATIIRNLPEKAPRVQILPARNPEDARRMRRSVSSAGRRKKESCE